MNTRRGLGVALIVGILPLAGCVTYPPGWDVEEEGRDPYEGANRVFFGFNDGVDRYVLGPVAGGWRFITPSVVRVSIQKFFINLGFPVRFLSSLGQGKVVWAGNEMGRFLLNTTVGIVGFFDPATHFGMPRYDEDFGQMFGAWGVPAGPYWVIPIFGPSHPRDAFGLIFDTALNPKVLATGAGVFETINDRAIAGPQVDTAREAALDLYVAARDAYIPQREAEVRNVDSRPRRERNEPAVPEDLYDFDLEEDGAVDEGEPDATP